jgi:hypothetical protein
MTPAERYLRLCTSYCDELGGLRWSPQEDALEYRHGSVFAFSEEIAVFLEGFAANGRLVHFAFVLHLLHLLRHVDQMSPPGLTRLCQAFIDAERPLRNAGAFCAVLCRDVPEAVDPPLPYHVFDRLRDLVRPLRWYVSVFHDTFNPSELPPLTPAQFEEEVRRQLEPYTAEELRDWLRHGRGPVREAAKALAQALPPPRTLSGALAALLERPRLAGARPFVDQLLGALALPPRPHRRAELPVGGYADVATHGQPHELLPSQFALDELDFLRRYGDRELLYFRREEPHARTRHELVVLLDQGVRTWGDVRLVLAAAVLALGRQAVRGKLPFRVAATSAVGEPLDPVEAGDARLGELLEASDLSANPGLALESVLERPAEASRDVVLLTHPRNLAEEDVRAAALRATAQTRVLALALDGHGRAALSELRHGVPVSLRQFRVDFTGSAALAQTPARGAEHPGCWTGDVEPVGFPFRFGTSAPQGIHLFDFDQQGQWLLTLDGTDLMHVWPTSESRMMEMLPRPFVGNRLLPAVQTLMGVAGGFVVISPAGHELVVIHYDIPKRTCTAHALREWGTTTSWTYAAERHAIIGFDLGGFQRELDLRTGRTSVPTASVPALPTICEINPSSGQVWVSDPQTSWKPFIPLADGRPVLAGCKASRWECRAGVLAVVTDSGHSSDVRLRLFCGPHGTALADYPMVGWNLALSSDGRLLARHLSFKEVEVRSTSGDGAPVARTYFGGVSAHSSLVLGKDWLLLRSGKQNLQLLAWGSDALKLERTRGNPVMSLDESLIQYAGAKLVVRAVTPGLEPQGVVDAPQGVPSWLHYDRKRFVSGATTTVTAVLDRFGQVSILDRDQHLVCMFFVFRDHLSGWLPDGTCFGPNSAAGRPPTADDLKRFGSALARASAAGRSAACK